MENRFGSNLRNLLRNHLHILLYTYFWFGLFICGLVAPQNRIDMLGSSIIKEGWHLSVLSLILIFPVPLLYIIRMRRK